MKNNKGTGIKIFFIISVVLLSLLAVLCAMSSRQSIKQFKHLTDRHEDATGCIALAEEIRIGSDILTNTAHSYIVTGEERYLDEYWDEIKIDDDEHQHRKRALAELRARNIDEEYLSYAEEAFKLSESLRVLETHAMALAVHTYKIDLEAYPEVRDFPLTQEELALDSQGKQDAAIKLLFSKEHDEHKSAILENIHLFEFAISSHMQNELDTLTDQTRKSMIINLVMLVAALADAFVILIVFYLRLIKPLMKIRQALQNNQPIESSGSGEFKQLIEAYNKSKEEFKAEVTELETQSANWQKKSRIDHLTQLANRMTFDEYLSSLLAIPDKKFTLYMIDVDDFKSVNDAYGHNIGDKTLQAISGLLDGVAQKHNGFASRFGGEEFTIITTDVSQDDVLPIGDEILKAIRKTRIDEAPDLRITVSVGSCHSDTCNRSPEDIFKKADIALYKSKSSGKNCHYRYLELL